MAQPEVEPEVVEFRRAGDQSQMLFVSNIPAKFEEDELCVSERVRHTGRAQTTTRNVCVAQLRKPHSLEHQDARELFFA